MNLLITLNLKQAAKFLNVSTEYLRRKAQAGEIKGAKIGKRWVFIKEDLIAYIRTQYVKNNHLNNSTDKLSNKRSNKKWSLEKETIPEFTTMKLIEMEKEYEKLFELN